MTKARRQDGFILFMFGVCAAITLAWGGLLFWLVISAIQWLGRN